MKVRWRRKTLRVFLFGVFLRSCLVESLVNRLLTPTSRLLPTFVPCYFRLLTYQFLARQVIATPIADAINPRRHQYVGNLPHWPSSAAAAHCSQHYCAAGPVTFTRWRCPSVCLFVRSFVAWYVALLPVRQQGHVSGDKRTNEQINRRASPPRKPHALRLGFNNRRRKPTLVHACKPILHFTVPRRNVMMMMMMMMK